MIARLLPDLPRTLDSFAPKAPIRDRSFWEQLPTSIRKSIISDAKRLEGYEYPPLKATLYMDFKRTGNRVRFEEPYFSRRRALCSFALAECVANTGGYLDRVIDGIDALCGETAWQLPAHNSYVRDAPQLILPDTGESVLDLFACETGALLAMVRYLLKDRLDAVSPFICERIMRLLDERIIVPYLNRHFWWMGNGDEPMCNWTPWCTQNVLLTAAATERDQETLHLIVKKAAYSLDSFLKDYGDDGCCSEGAQYYRHAGLCLFGSIEILDAMAKGVFAPLYREEKIRNIARYIEKAHVADKYYINFADCSPIAGRAGTREYLFGKRIRSRELSLFALEDWSKDEAHTLPEEINLFYRLQAIGASGEMEAEAKKISKPPKRMKDDSPDAWYPSVGLFIARTSRLCLAVKAGGNGDSHNHNDTGSFILYKDGLPCVIDVGVENYTAKTFSSERYSIWTMQSAWHNLPTFGGHMQRDGAEYRAEDVELKSGKNESVISMELSGAWEKGIGIDSYKRSVTLSKTDDTVTVEDRYSGTLAPVLSLMTAAEPKPLGARIAIGSLAVIEIAGVSADGKSSIVIEPVAIRDARLFSAWGERIWRIHIPFGDRMTLVFR